jgi:hypothetical protein
MEQGMKLGMCGDRCDVCPRYVATATDDAVLFERIMRIYVKTGLRGENSPLDSLRCSGCSRENKCAYSVVRDCAMDKQIRNCGECSDYPCDEINKVFQITEDFRKRLEQVCSKEEFALFDRAFFRKKEYLSKVANIQ